MEEKIKIENLKNFNESYNEISTLKRKTRKFLSKYEKAKIISCRAQQIANNFPALIKKSNEKYLSAEELTLQELENNNCPIILRRHMPDNTYEDWKLKELN